MNKEVYDVIGVGLGSYNMALLNLLKQKKILSFYFLEANSYTTWRRNALFFCAKSVPQSFRNFFVDAEPKVILQADKTSFTTLANIYKGQPPHNCEHYVNNIEYNSLALKVTIIHNNNEQLYKVTCNSGIEYFARNIVLGTGRSPFIPDCFSHLIGLKVFHYTQYPKNISRYSQDEKLRIAIIGECNGAALSIKDITKRLPNATIAHFNILDSDVLFANESNTKQILSDLYICSKGNILIKKNIILKKVINFNLSLKLKSIKAESCFIKSIHREGHYIKFIYHPATSGATISENFDMVILATGFINSGLHNTSCPSILKPIEHVFCHDPTNKYLKITDSYALVSKRIQPMPPSLFLNYKFHQPNTKRKVSRYHSPNLRAKVIIRSIYNKF